MNTIESNALPDLVFYFREPRTIMLLIEWLEAYCKTADTVRLRVCVGFVFSEVEGTRLLKPGQDGTKAVILATRQNVSIVNWLNVE